MYIKALIRYDLSAIRLIMHNSKNAAPRGIPKNIVKKCKYSTVFEEIRTIRRVPQ